jgi:hypothetical protein
MRSFKYVVTVVILGVILVFFNSGCLPKQVTKLDVSQDLPAPRISAITGDTLFYSIEFNNVEEREKFLSKFRTFLQEYPYAKLQASAGETVLVKISPVKGDGTGDKQAEQLSTQRAEYVGNVIQKTVDASKIEDTIPAADTIVPEYGGAIKIYSQRGTLDETLSSLFDLYPFETSSGPGVLTEIDSSPKKVTLQLNGKITNGKGKILSALDLIESWTSLVKSHPAEGLALFRYVEGVREFIDGREAVIRGFLATDQYTVQLRLSQADSYATDRIRTSRLLDYSLKLGRYFIEQTSADEIVALTNKLSGKKAGYLDKLTIKTGGDVNPILSFSLKKFDIITLVTNNDLDYARSNLTKAGKLNLISRDHYFISCNSTDQKLRKYVEGVVNPAEILKNIVKAEGEILHAIEDDANGIEQSDMDHTQPGIVQPIKVVFRKDDPVSKMIAEKILADFSQDNVPGVLMGVANSEYERTLIAKNYTCAVGWVTDSVKFDMSEKLRLATIWFNDEINEKTRIETNQEIPLFVINKYLLSRNAIVIPENNIKDLFLQHSVSGNSQ